MWQIPYPPANGASRGNCFLPKSHKVAVFEEKNCLTKTNVAAKRANFFSIGFWFWLDERSNNLLYKKFVTWVFAIDVLIFFSPFCLASPDKIGVKVDHRQSNSLTPYTGVCRFFLSVKLATSLLALLAGGSREKNYLDRSSATTC